MPEPPSNHSMPEVWRAQEGAHSSENEPALRRGIGLGYGSWLRPYTNIDSVDLEPTSSAVPKERAEPIPEPVTEQRRRGRPRVFTARDSSALEKRREQVRNAQRRYQQRKGNAAEPVNNERDELLQVLSDISTVVEGLLAVASKAGMLEQENDVGIQMRRLWDTYNVAINRPCLGSELRTLQTKNEQRRADHRSKENFRTGHPDRSKETQETGTATGRNPSDSDISLVRGGETTVLQSFSHTQTANRVMGGRSMMDVVRDRQAQFRNPGNPPL